MKKWHIYFIMWVSWAGKGTLINNLKKEDLDLHIPISYKSRKKRDFEIDGVDAHFISRENFEKSIENKEFLEYAIVHKTDYYGTKFIDVIDNWLEKWKIVIKELDVLWLKRLMNKHPEYRENYTTIFLNIPINKLKERLNIRWDNVSDLILKNREESAIMEEQEARKYCDYMLDATKQPEKVLKEVLDIIS